MAGAGERPFPAIGRIERQSPALDALIAQDARIEALAEGFLWSEGPVWVEEGGYLLFSDVPGNRMYRWSQDQGLSVFLDPSGHPGPDTSGFREPGSNGLIRGPGDTILLCDHGNRAVASLDLPTRRKTLLATHYRGKRFNSPNDLVRASSGAIYFTDPPYGLEGLDASPLKELPHNGVYRIDPGGAVTLLDDGLTFPNGIILSPDERTLYVAVSDPEAPVWMAYELDAQGGIASRRLFADASAERAAGLPGLPDGMAIDVAGTLFATGPGGVLVLTPDGARLGRIETGTAIANCTFGDDGSTLYMASHHRIARLRTSTKGLPPSSRKG